MSTDGQPINLTGEIQPPLGGGRVRAVALGSTDGLRRGMDVVDTGKPVTVPVGKETLGRVFNLLGEPIDGRGPVTAAEYRPIHADPRSEEHTSELQSRQYLVCRLLLEKKKETVHDM